MKEAIEILDLYIAIMKDDAPPQFQNGIRCARALIWAGLNHEHTWQPSPDTPYKIELTEWIEAKHQAGNPYSVFEEWQKVCPRTTEEGEG
jgi:hypothetical protein